jgi:hypothetical protein
MGSVYVALPIKYFHLSGKRLMKYMITLSFNSPHNYKALRHDIVTSAKRKGYNPPKQQYLASHIGREYTKGDYRLILMHGSNPVMLQSRQFRKESSNLSVEEVVKRLCKPFLDIKELLSEHTNYHALEDYLNLLQGISSHITLTPGKILSDQAHEDSMRIELELAVKREDFERAAAIRDKLRQKK